MAGKVLAIAVASGKAGYVYLKGTQLVDWGVAVKVVKSGPELAGYVQELINELKPDVLVTEKLSDSCRKGQRSRSLIRSIAELASHNPVLDVAVERSRVFPSKYEEAAYLIGKHPELSGYRPEQKRRLFGFEPRSMVVFEALAMAEIVTSGPPDALVAAMG